MGLLAYARTPVLLGMLALSSGALSSSSGEILDSPFLSAAQLSDDALSDMRGGFEDDRFSNFAFSYERISIINDVVVDHEYITLPGIEAPENEGVFDLNLSEFMTPDVDHMPGETDPMILSDGLATTIQIMDDNQSVQNHEIFNLDLHDVDQLGNRAIFQSAEDSVIDTILNNF